MRGDLVSLDVIKHGLQQRLDALVQELYPAAKLDTARANWCLGSLAGEPGQSLRIARAPAKLGWWKDYSTGEGGDVLTLINRALGHGDMGSTIRWARDWQGLGAPLSAAERHQRERAAEEASRRAAAQDRQDRQAKRSAALRCWLEARPIIGTPAERYLLGRNIQFARLGKWPGALRYHAGMRCPVTGADRPCMLAKLDAPDGDFLTVHRTFLLVHGDGRVTKADKRNGGPLDDAKMAFGPYAGGAISVWKGESGRSLRHLAVGEWVAMTEGIEDALTVAMARPALRVLSALSLSNIANVRLPDRLGGLYLCADNDIKPEPQAAFARAVASIEARGFAVRVVRPPAGMKDFNDWAAALTRPTTPQQAGGAA